MYRDNGFDKGYEDAIPIRRSRKAEKSRSELRKNASRKSSSTEFYITKKDSHVRKNPVKTSYDQMVHSETRRVSDVIKYDDHATTKVSELSYEKNNIEKVTADADVAVAIKDKPVSVLNTDPIIREKNATLERTNKHRDRSPKSSVTSNDFFQKNEVETVTLTSPEVDVHKGFHRVANMHTVFRDSLVDIDLEIGVHKSESIESTLTIGKVVRRTLLSVFTALFLVIAAVFGACYTVAVGPSESVRNVLVLSALQASATKWVPGLFLDDAVVEQILEDSKKVNKDVISVEDYQNSQKEETENDIWANAIDGMVYESVSGPTFKGYVLLVKDPSRVTVGVATNNFTNDTPGLRIFDMADKYGAVAAINGGEYPDAGGMGIGGRPIGLTYSNGECVWNDGLRRSFMGFDENNKLIVREGLTKAQAEELGIRDGVCFQTGKTLITNEDGNVTLYYADNDTGTAQRTAIGQAADGTVIMLVTDGRTASSLGATHNDVIDVMVSYGAISAGMLDGGSSSLMYYRDFYDKYGLDKSELDEYQRMGLINKYKAFTTPRRLPTCFIVAPE